MSSIHYNIAIIIFHNESYFKQLVPMTAENNSHMTENNNRYGKQHLRYIQVLEVKKI